MPRTNSKEDFWRSVDRKPGNECWEWKKSRSPRGYGKTHWQGRGMRAHRLAFFLATGELPEAVCHHCDNPPCCNPSHLFGGTNHDNDLDRVRKNRSARQRGEAHGNSKLTSEIVIKIREEYAAGNVSQRALAAKFNLSRGHIKDLIKRRRWAHI